MFSNGMTTNAPSASITRWRASSASFSRTASDASSSVCWGNSSSFFEPSTKWMMRRRCSAMRFLPGLHRFELARAQRYALPDAEAMHIAAPERAAFADVHRHGDLVRGFAQARLHLGRAGGAEAPALGLAAAETELRHSA